MKLRDRKGLSQADLATAIDVDRKTMGKIEADKWRPKKREDEERIVRAIAHVVGPYPVSLFSSKRGWILVEEAGDWTALLMAHPKYDLDDKLAILRLGRAALRAKTLGGDLDDAGDVRDRKDDKGLTG